MQECDVLQSRMSADLIQVKCYLLHVPDETTPISETMEGIQALYLAGHFDQVNIILSLYLEGISSGSNTASSDCQTFPLLKSKNATTTVFLRIIFSQPSTRPSTVSPLGETKTLSSPSSANSTSRSKSTLASAPDFSFEPRRKYRTARATLAAVPCWERFCKICMESQHT